MPETICKSKGAAMAALETIAGVLTGTQREVLKAITKWIDENVNDTLLPEEMLARINRIFEGTEAEKAGKRWYENEISNPAYTRPKEDKDGHLYHKMFNEPEDGAVRQCFWSAKYKRWEPEEIWPIIQHQTVLAEEE